MWRAAILVVLALLLPAVAAAETTKPIRMKVVDSATGKPVGGAQVRYGATATEGTFTGHGGRTATLFELTTESDAEGTITFPPTRFDHRVFGLFGLNTNYENARMTILKPGYAPMELRNQTRIMPNLDEVIAWEYNGQTVQLRPAREASAPARSPGGAGTPPPVMIRRGDEGLPQHRAAPAPAR